MYFGKTDTIYSYYADSDNLTQAYDISMPIKNMINETYARDISNKD